MHWLSDKVLQRLRTAADAPDLSATKYRLLQKSSAGGMGTIYLAEDAQLQRKVALKVMHLADPTGEMAARMMREARVIARLEHPGIVPVHDVGELPDGRMFYVMKFVQGQRLDQYASDQRALPERLRVFQKICEAVAFAHARGVIHRDLKPENVMVGAFGEVLVMDWGLAKILSENSKIEDRGLKIDNQTSSFNPQSSILDPRSSTLDPGASGPGPQRPTQHATIMGTPAYMAPEQHGRVCAGSDPQILAPGRSGDAQHRKRGQWQSSGRQYFNLCSPFQQDAQILDRHLHQSNGCHQNAPVPRCPRSRQ